MTGFLTLDRAVSKQTVCPHCGVEVDESITQANAICQECGAVLDEGDGATAALGGWLRGSISTFSSIVFHTALVLLLALFAYDRRSPTAWPGEEVVIGELPSEQLKSAQDDHELSSPESSRKESEQLQEAEAVAAADPSSSSQELEINLAASALGSGAFANGEMGSIGGGGGALGQSATFMGLQAKGNRFCIIADRSGSMKGAKLAHVKYEMQKTLDRLPGKARFHLYFFSNSPFGFPPASDGWAVARKQRTEAVVWLNGVNSQGGTHPAPAFQRALALKPLPHAIFFMTDGLFARETVAFVDKLNAGGNRRVPIHTICFIDRSAEAAMKKIAKDSGGKYRYVGGF